MFDLAEIQDRIKKHEKLLDGIGNKMQELKNNFDDIFVEYLDKDEDYFQKNPKKLDELNETIRKRMSLYDLLRETAENIREQTKQDMQTVYEELQKNQYYES